ncbi:hypothetical protein [Clostridium lacusfryxellense]|uniref:hypothetical protein n=1 Tax=Clostridium lacusfryxellense TaxID=205328 RepID=UPI001C0D24F4|nr:hypothetical protein [Clostridium lacusfryxellense]MBU3114277.1 hypothetical protein [Clostridium lacusfryxellense]
MIKKLLFVLFFFVIFSHSTYVSAEMVNNIEIFDPKQNKVVKVIKANPEIQDMITSWITNIDGLYKNDPATDDGYVVKIPLDPIVKVNCKAFNALVSDVYILIPEKEPPCYLIFDDETKLLSLPFNGDIDMLSKVLNFKLRK